MKGHISCDGEFPGVYLAVSPYLSWIVERQTSQEKGDVQLFYFMSIIRSHVIDFLMLIGFLIITDNESHILNLLSRITSLENQLSSNNIILHLIGLGFAFLAVPFTGNG